MKIWKLFSKRFAIFIVSHKAYFENNIYDLRDTARNNYG